MLKPKISTPELVWSRFKTFTPNLCTIERDKSSFQNCYNNDGTAPIRRSIVHQHICVTWNVRVYSVQVNKHLKHHMVGFFCFVVASFSHEPNELRYAKLTTLDVFNPQIETQKRNSNSICIHTKRFQTENACEREWKMKHITC